MIRNERQYRVTLAERERLAAHLADAARLTLAPDPAEATNTPVPVDATTAHRDTVTDVPDWVRTASQDALSAQLLDLDESLADYEDLRSGAVPAAGTVNELAKLPHVLIRARIAAGLTQKDLADRLGLREQQIQRYEADGYTGANLARLSAVMSALDVHLDASLQLPSEKGAASNLHRTLKMFGLSGKVLTRRFGSTGANADTPTDWFNVATRAARIFNTDLESLLDGDLAPVANLAAFRATSAANVERLNGYAHYAEYLASLLRRVCTQPYRPLPASDELRDHLRPHLARNPLEALLDVCWDHGIPVLPLADGEAFDGACWPSPDGPVIALNNATRTPERWAFLLGHELDHANHPDEPSVLEEGFDVRSWRERPTERRADAFAATLLLDGHAEAMTQVAVKAANHDLSQLKRVVPEVAEAGDVNAGILADHIAYRIDAPGTNWWPTARRLHTGDVDAWRITRTALFRHVDLSLLDDLDRDILIDGIAP